MLLFESFDPTPEHTALVDKRNQDFCHCSWQMSRRPSPCRSVFFFVFVLLSSLRSAAMILPGKSGTTAGGRSKVSKRRTTSLWTSEERGGERAATVFPSRKQKRQLFLSSVCSRFAFIVVTATGASIPQVATAMNPVANDDNLLSTPNRLITSSRRSARVLSLNLRSLPVSGCWAATVTLSKNLDNAGVQVGDNDFFSYLAVVDTGSPFLTAPAGALQHTQKIGTSTFAKRNKKETKRGDDISDEQYGNTIGTIQWRKAPFVTLIGNGEVENIPNVNDGHPDVKDDAIFHKTELESVIIQDESDILLGIPSEEVVEETGGIFFGLMTADAARPTPLQQLGYDAFAIRFRATSLENKRVIEIENSDEPATLILWDGKQRNTRNEETRSASTTSLIDCFDPYSMALFDLTPYGPNLHHYGVLVDRLECLFSGNEVVDAVAFDYVVGSDSSNSYASDRSSFSLSRPLVAVFDTGLSGCIFSDTLWEEIQLERRKLKKDETRRQQRREKFLDNYVVDNKNHGNSRENAMRLNESNPKEITPIACTVSMHTIGPSKSTSKASISPPSGVKLSSVSKYWRFQSFRLPWWYSDVDIAKDDGKIRNDKFPHVVVLGSTFWRNPNILELVVDTTSKRAKIITMVKT